MAIPHIHKQTFVIFTVCVVAVLGAIWYTHGFKYNLSLKQSVSIGDKNNVEDIGSDYSYTVSSSTSISADWKKQFLTNTPYQKSVNKAVTAKSDAPLTVTDQLGRSFLTNYITLQQGGLANDDNAVKGAVNDTIQNTLDSVDGPKVYSIADVIVGTNDLRAYGNALGLIFTKYIPDSSAPAIAQQALSSQNINDLKKIDSVILGYQNILTYLLQTPVPRNLVANHVNLINAISSIVYVSNGLRNVDKDPMKGMVALGLYTPTLEAMQSAIQTIQSYFVKNNIVFTTNEIGGAISKAYFQ